MGANAAQFALHSHRRQVWPDERQEWEVQRECVPGLGLRLAAPEDDHHGLTVDGGALPGLQDAFDTVGEEGTGFTKHEAVTGYSGMRGLRII